MELILENLDFRSRLSDDGLLNPNNPRIQIKLRFFYGRPIKEDWYVELPGCELVDEDTIIATGWIAVDTSSGVELFDPDSGELVMRLMRIGNNTLADIKTAPFRPPILRSCFVQLHTSEQLKNTSLGWSISSRARALPASVSLIIAIATAINLGF